MTKKIFMMTLILGLVFVSSAWSQDACAPLLKEKMYQEDWDAYLNCLEGEINDIESENEGIQAELDALEEELEALMQEKENFAGEEEAIQARIDEILASSKGLEDLLADLKALPTEYTVEDGDLLATISAREDIYRDPAKWPRIYHANKYIPKNKYGEARVGKTADGGTFKMRNPNMIYPGWILKIPRDWPKEIQVVPGDCLWKIAGFWWVYDTPTNWPKIHEQNKDQIKDPDLIYPNQIFKVREY